TLCSGWGLLIPMARSLRGGLHCITVRRKTGMTIFILLSNLFVKMEPKLILSVTLSGLKKCVPSWKKNMVLKLLSLVVKVEGLPVKNRLNVSALNNKDGPCRPGMNCVGDCVRR